MRQPLSRQGFTERFWRHTFGGKRVFNKEENEIYRKYTLGDFWRIVGFARLPFGWSAVVPYHHRNTLWRAGNAPWNVCPLAIWRRGCGESKPCGLSACGDECFVDSIGWNRGRFDASDFGRCPLLYHHRHPIWLAAFQVDDLCTYPIRSSGNL